MAKASGAFLTIGELAAELRVPQHILRYWETRFSQLRPLQRAGNRRYYRPEDVELARRIHDLLNNKGYTVRGAQRALADKEQGREKIASPASDASLEKATAPVALPAPAPDILPRLIQLREYLAAQL